MKSTITLQCFQRYAGNHGSNDMYYLSWNQRQVDNRDRTIGGLVSTNVIIQPLAKGDALLIGYDRAHSCVRQEGAYTRHKKINKLAHIFLFCQNFKMIR